MYEEIRYFPTIIKEDGINLSTVMLAKEFLMFA